MRTKLSLLSVQLIMALSLTGCASFPIPTTHHQSQPNSEQPRKDVPVISPQQLQAQRDKLDKNPIYLILAAEMSGQANQIGQAAHFYDEATTNSDDVDLLQRSTEIALFAKQYDLAARSAQKWLAVQPDSPKAAASLTIAEIQLGDFAKADEALDHWIANDKRGRAQIFTELGEYLGKNTKKGTSLEYGKHLSERFPESSNAQILLTRMALKLNHPHSAVSAARQAVALEPNNRTAHELLIIALSETGDTKGVINALKAARAHFPHDTRFTSALIEANIRAGNTALAGKLLQHTLKQRVDDVDVLRNLALFGLQLNRPVLAEKALQQLKRQPGQRDEAELLLGRLAQQTNEPAKAIAHFKRVSPSSHRYVEARILLASVLMETEGLDAALSSLRLATAGKAADQLDVADLQRITLAKAGLQQASEHFHDALDTLNEGLTRWPDANDIKLQRALVLFRLHRPDEAKQTLRDIIASDPDNAAALNALGFTLLEEKQQLDEAGKMIRKALKTDPGNSAYIDSLGWYYYRIGKLQEAEEQLRKAFKMTPDAEIGAHLGTVLWKQDKKDEARSFWKRSLKIDPDSQPLQRALKQFAPELLKTQE